MIVLQHRQQFVFDIYIDDDGQWNIERLIWIAFYKNIDNKDCLFATLPKDLTKIIIRFAETRVDESVSFVHI